jgi:GrpB-like predicted nucleotidyltransferase (UPF0157 family)
VTDADPIFVASADPLWPTEFQDIAGRLRRTLGESALRIDHIGSTAVPGPAAKPVIDIQISVAALIPDERFRLPLESLGYKFQITNADRAKRFFREPAGARRTHVHVRRAGSFDEQLNLLLRDYLRSHEDACRNYAQVKRELAQRFHDDRQAYVHSKEPIIWSLLLQAHDWLEATGWSPGPSDA